jgi:hypothetical protein
MRHRAIPFRTIRLTTLVTPDIDPTQVVTMGNTQTPTNSSPLGFPAFWVRDASTLGDVQFGAHGTDWEGREITFAAPQIFVYGSDGQTNSNQAGRRLPPISLPPAFDLQATQALITNYASETTRRVSDLGGQAVALAESAVPNSTTLHIGDFHFNAELPAAAADAAALLGADQPGFFPTLGQAMVQVPGIDQLTGPDLPPIPPQAIKMVDQYLSHGFNPISNPAEAFAIADQLAPQALQFAKDAAGGIALPDFGVGGFTRQLGPVGGDLNDLLGDPSNLTQFTGNGFSPSAVFDKLGGKILGAIPLSAILKSLLDTAKGASPIPADQALAELKKLPKVPVEVLYPNNDHSKLPQALRTTLAWNPAVKTVDIGSFTGFFEVDYDPQKKTALTIKAVIVTPITDPSGSTYDIVGQLDNARINLFGTDAATNYLIVTIKRLKFTAKTGAKPHLDVDVGDVSFGQALKFVEEFEKYLASLGGPSIKLSKSGVVASYSVNLPTIGVGIFTLSNVSLGFSLNIPFTDDGAVRLRAYFCTREHPFTLTVSMFGGGGFFGLALGLDGLEILEASLEFGAAAALDIGVASGEAHILAGIYFALTLATPHDSVELSGFVRAGGRLKVLGLITLSLEFYLSLTYKDPPGKAIGTATMTVGISILFFSTSVTLTVQKQFGNGADPTFAELLSPSDWSDYCAAFQAA